MKDDKIGLKISRLLKNLPRPKSVTMVYIVCLITIYKALLFKKAPLITSASVDLLNFV